MNTKNKIADLLIRVAGIAYIFAFFKQKLPMMTGQCIPLEWF